ncbi:UDP-glucuronosyltransferase 1A5-like [Schistocerca gregaria]|uniref:UDP-glucuronosyltransferase 1A5-like n=1 Tax=Schistocerca gregaria TaxID=7010 RepID=UPI00211F0BA4|nr:UDP-glucuronosyltransferase 1A5-like [Schistocerca gregaria]
MNASVPLILVMMVSARVNHSARILGIIPTSSISHQLPFRLIALELAKRGHQVTVMTTDPIRLGSPPTIGYVYLGSPAPVLPYYGNPNNPAYCYDFMVGYTDHMSFWERLYNTYVMARISYTWNYVTMPSQNELIRRYFGPDHPPMQEIDTNFSLLTVNNHFSVNYPRPLLPNVIEVTGLHLEKQRKPLPQLFCGAEQESILKEIFDRIPTSPN